MSLRASEISEREQLRYAKLLCHVVSAARKSRFPAKNPFEMSCMSSALPVAYDVADSYGDLDDTRSTAHIETSKKIAAAGELFVSYDCHS